MMQILKKNISPISEDLLWEIQEIFKFQDLVRHLWSGYAIAQVVLQFSNTAIFECFRTAWIYSYVLRINDLKEFFVCNKLTIYNIHQRTFSRQSRQRSLMTSLYAVHALSACASCFPNDWKRALFPMKIWAVPTHATLLAVKQSLCNDKIVIYFW